MDDKKIAEEYAAAGVDLPELKDTPKEEPKAPVDEAPKEPKSEEPKVSQAPLQETPQEPRKRSIYDVYKEEKFERKEAQARAEQLERDNIELRQKLEAVSIADPGKDKADAEKDLRTYATEKGADPELVERIVTEARKGIKPELDPNVARRLERFETWEKNNAKTIEATLFNEEFGRILPALKEQFPNVSDDEVNAIKKELDAISHTKEWHDKDLDYVLFKNKDKLSTLVSPKKRGMESKERKDAPDTAYEFDPNADYSKLSPKEKEQWEAEYKKLGKTNGLIDGARGKIII